MQQLNLNHWFCLSSMLPILLNSTCWHSIRLTALDKSSPANDMVSSLTSRRLCCFIFTMAWETSPIEGRFLGVLCKHLWATLAKVLTSSVLHVSAIFVSIISSTPSGLIAALEEINKMMSKNRQKVQFISKFRWGRIVGLTRLTYSIKFWCGWMAVMSSKSIIPKLYTSLFVVK